MQLLSHTPGFDVESASRIAEKKFGRRARARMLPSERDQNFLLADEAGEKFVLKIANALELRELLEGQNAAMDHLRDRGGFCPRVGPAGEGDVIVWGGE